MIKCGKTWFVVADGGRARFVERCSQGFGLETRREFTAADIHDRSHDLGSDRPGRGHESDSSMRHAIEPRQDRHLARKTAFAHEIAMALNRASASGAFDHLVIVAPPHIAAALRHGLEGPTENKVIVELHKDLTKVPDVDLVSHLADWC
jgi:protein required for attachment to host cells